jgi:hypothetical protein
MGKEAAASDEVERAMQFEEERLARLKNFER